MARPRIDVRAGLGTDVGVEAPSVLTDTEPLAVSSLSETLDTDTLSCTSILMRHEPIQTETSMPDAYDETIVPKDKALYKRLGAKGRQHLRKRTDVDTK